MLRSLATLLFSDPFISLTWLFLCAECDSAGQLPHACILQDLANICSELLPPLWQDLPLLLMENADGYVAIENSAGMTY